jgi:hypothetical protein
VEKLKTRMVFKTGLIFEGLGVFEALRKKKPAGQVKKWLSAKSC